MSRILRAAGAALVLSAGLLAGPATLNTASAQEPDPHFEEPTVGECHDYGWATLISDSDTSAPVECSASHRAKVIAVMQLPESMTWDSDPVMIGHTIIKACNPEFESVLGRTEGLRHRSAYSLAYYVPTQEQKDAGARWLRCDLVLIGRQQLMPIPRDATPILHAPPLPASEARCLYGDNLYLTVCSKNHRYKATGTYFVDRDTYPSRDTWVNIGRRKCPSRVTTSRYYFTWPGRWSWRALGDHTLICYSKHTL